MFQRLRNNLREGLYRMKWFAVVLSERMKLEIAVIRLLYQSDTMEKNREELLKGIGLRVYELSDNPDKNVLRDRAILASLEEIRKIERDIDELKKKVSEMSGARV